MIYGGTPSPAAVRGLLRTVFAGSEDEADFNFYDLSQVFVSVVVLACVYVWLHVSACACLSLRFLGRGEGGGARSRQSPCERGTASGRMLVVAPGRGAFVCFLAWCEADVSRLYLV